MTTTQNNELPVWVQDRDKAIAHSTNDQWRDGKIPDYTESKIGLAAESTCNHVEGSLEAIVQNLVRTFEMEVSFKTNPEQWLSVVRERFRMSSNGGKQYTAEDVVKGGTYNLFIGDTDAYKASEETFESSGRLFRGAFPKGFLWEVLEVYSGPPNIAFKWRHWGTFTGSYKDYSPTGETIEIIGMSVAQVTEDLKISAVEHYFDNTQFFAKLTSAGDGGNEKQTDNSLWSFFRKLWRRSEEPTVRVQENFTQQTEVSACPFHFRW